MWSKTVTVTSSPRVAEVGNKLRDVHVAGLVDLEIPLWAKPTTANIGVYVSMVTSHQAEATRCIATQRAAAQCANWGQEVSSSASTMAEDSGDEGSVEDSSAHVDDGRPGTDAFSTVADVSDGVTSAISEPTTLESLVAGLREARIHAHSRRMALAATSQCEAEEPATEYVATQSCRSSGDLIASVRRARHMAEARRLTQAS